MMTFRSLSRHQPMISFTRFSHALSMVMVWGLVMWHCQRTGMRIALKPASFTALIVRLVTTGLPHAVSTLMLLSAMPISIVSPSCPGAEHSSWLPRFHPTTSLFHSCAVGCAFILILISMSSSVVKMFLKFMIIKFLLVDCKNTKKNANHQIFCHLSTNFFDE